MSEENLEQIRRWIEQWNSGDFDAVLAQMDPDIEVEIAMGSPMDGVYHGHAGLVRR
jgi:hypothetical protein